jgi:hypothetical protein
MHFEWLEFQVVTLPHATFHCLSDLQFKAVRQICGKQPPQPTYRLVDRSEKIVWHLLTDAEREALHALWPLPEQFVGLGMKSEKAWAMAVIDPKAARDRFVDGSVSIRPHLVWILPGAKLGKVEDSLKNEPRQRRQRLIGGSGMFESLGPRTLETAEYFSNATEACSFVVGSQQALRTYGYDIDGIPLAEKPQRQLPNEYFEQRLSSGRPATRLP